MIFQGFNLVNNLTVEQNVELSLKFAGVKNLSRRRAPGPLRPSKLWNWPTKQPLILRNCRVVKNNVSRLPALWRLVRKCCCAMSPPPHLTRLPRLRCCNTWLTLIENSGITVVVVTHEMEVIKALTDHVAVMESGRIVERFAAQQLHDPAFSPSTPIVSTWSQMAFTSIEPQHRWTRCPQFWNLRMSPLLWQEGAPNGTDH